MSSWQKHSKTAGLPKLRGTFESKTDTMFSQWAPKYWCLEGDKLFYYKSKAHLEHLGCIALNDIVTVKPRANTDRNVRQWVVEILCESGSTFLNAVTADKMTKWINGLKQWMHYFDEQKEQVKLITQPNFHEHAQHLLEDIGKRNSGTDYQVPGSYGKKDSSSELDTGKDSVQVLRSKVNLLEDWIQKQIMFIEDMGSKWSEAEDRHQQEIQELNSKFETKRKQFEMLIDRKDQQILQERQARWKNPENQKMDQILKRLNELEERNKHLEEENKKLKQQPQDNENATEQTPTSTTTTVTQDGHQSDINKLLKENSSLKRKYFFALATGIKVMTAGNGGKNMDLNEMYEKVVNENIPINAWDRFIYDYAK